MKKISIAVLFAALFVSAVSAYEVPKYGENMYELSSPTALTSGASVTGGSILYVSSESIIANPAIISKEQRVEINLADTVLFSANKANEVKGGDAFQVGIVIPFKMFVVGSYINGVFDHLDEMPLGDNISLRMALGKEVTDKLSIGVGLNSALGWHPAFDWALGADLGFVYFQGKVGFLQDFRYGASIMNLGKTYNVTEKDFFGYPTFATIKGGVAASLVKNDLTTLGMSVDFTTPFFQNLIIDTGLKLSVKNMLYIGISEKINLVETLKGNYNFMPAVSLSFKFSFDVHGNEVNGLATYMERHDWSESELNVTTGWKKLYGTAHAVSVGADLCLGMQDTTPPVIQILFDEEEDEE